MINSTMISQNVLAGTSLRMFREMLAYGSRCRFWARLTHRKSHLLDLEETLKGRPVEAGYSAGIKTVSIDHIVGTEGKSKEFDAQFNPTQERSLARWIGIAAAKLRGHDLPPVELIQIDDLYYVRDGHHRISVSRALGQAYIDAEVTVLRLRQQNWMR